jgi:dolichol-phosphate mannosyltransferase
MREVEHGGVIASAGDLCLEKSERDRPRKGLSERCQAGRMVRSRTHLLGRDTQSTAARPRPVSGSLQRGDTMVDRTAVLPENAAPREKVNLMSAPNEARPKIAVVIPAFRAACTISAVVRGIGSEVSQIYVVDDGCPQASGASLLQGLADPRLSVVRHARNQGVGAAMKTGYRHALAGGADVIVKIDADGQMDPRHLPCLVEPILGRSADYTKGNRFAPRRLMPDGSDGGVGRMPLMRKAANRLLSALHKPATGYPHVSDPANGYTAICALTLARLDLDALADCFFFETDMLFRLNRVAARIIEVPLPAQYPARTSNLRLRNVAPRFAALLVDRTLQRARARVLNGGARRSLPAEQAAMRSR